MLGTVLVALTIMIPLWLLKVSGKTIWRRLFGDPLMGGKDIRAKDGLVSRVATAGLGLALPLGNPRENLATVFAAGRKQPKQQGTATVFEAPAGWRYGFLAVVAFFVYFCFHFEATSNSTDSLWDTYAIIGALFLYMGAYIWSYRLTIDGVALSNMSFLFMTKHYDLTQMVGARRGNDGYKLHFADGRVANVPLFIEGHDILIEFLGQELDANGC